MFLAMKSVTGAILAGSAQPTHVTPDTGKARAWRARTTLEVTDAPSSLSATDPHGAQARFLLAAPPKAAPAMSRLAALRPSSSSSSLHSSPSRSPSWSSSSSSYSRTRFFAFSRLRPPLRSLGRPRPPPPPRSLVVLDAPSRSLRPRISSSIMEIGAYIDSGRCCCLFPLPRPAPAAAAQTGCAGGAAVAPAPPPPPAWGRLSAFTASPVGSGGLDSSSLLASMARVDKRL